LEAEREAVRMPMTAAEPLEAMVARAREGDERAFAELATAVRGQVQRWALVRTGDADDAEDVAQTVVIRLHRHLGSFEGRSRFTTWLYRLTASAALDWVKGRGRRERAHLASAEPAALSAATDDRIAALDDQRTAALVRSFFTELPGRQREVFDLVDLQGFTPAEAGEMLEIEGVTARAHLFRARRAIRERILAAQPNLRDER
jgi:RNA polymerase sigma-70 factor, ECF subfamily